MSQLATLVWCYATLKPIHLGRQQVVIIGRIIVFHYQLVAFLNVNIASMLKTKLLNRTL
ncbi:hypothetical protein MUGA111182_03745 [Mucilaginibacter galii]